MSVAILAAFLMQAVHPPTVITQPDWLQRPSGADMAQFYPKLALGMRIEGRAVIQCSVTAEGALADCKVVAEDPMGAGFGDAALGLSTLFHMRPMVKDGRPVSGGTVRIPIMFRLPHPPAQAPTQ